MLKRIQNELYHYVDGVRVEGPNNDMEGDCSWLIGDCTGLSGRIEDNIEE